MYFLSNCVDTFCSCLFFDKLLELAEIHAFTNVCVTDVDAQEHGVTISTSNNSCSKEVRVLIFVV